jgi:hypothetical protein
MLDKTNSSAIPLAYICARWQNLSQIKPTRIAICWYYGRYQCLHSMKASCSAICLAKNVRDDSAHLRSHLHVVPYLWPTFVLDDSACLC